MPVSGGFITKVNILYCASAREGMVKTIVE